MSTVSGVGVQSFETDCLDPNGKIRRKANWKLSATVKHLTSNCQVRGEELVWGMGRGHWGVG
jgi:hypothetical protein